MHQFRRFYSEISFLESIGTKSAEDKMSNRQHACASHSLFGRRDFIQAGALGFLGLGLKDYFKLRSVQAAEKGEPPNPAVRQQQSAQL
jgi:hypothetical protein